MAQAKTLDHNISEEIIPFLDTGKIYEKNSPELLKLEAKIKSYSKLKPGSGYVDLACVSMLRGDFNEMHSRYQIAKNNGLNTVDHCNWTLILSHAGFFGEGTAYMKDRWDGLTEFEYGANAALAMNNFNAFKSIFLKGKDILMQNLSENDKNVFETNLVISDFVEDEKITDFEMASFHDIAGEILRKNNIYFCRRYISPLDITLAYEDNLYVNFIYEIPKSYDEAADLNWEFAERVFDLPIGQKVKIKFRGTF